MTEKDSFMLGERLEADWFRKASLEQLAAQLQQRNYPGYPEQKDRLWDDQPQMYVHEPRHIPYGPWETSNGELPGMLERMRFARAGLKTDSYGRPLHPWFDEMVSDPRIGVITGKGFYWKWGPNYTADPIIVRRDLGEPHVLLINRKDTGQLALPGGFIDGSESGVEAAARETYEETGVDIGALAPCAEVCYSGPVADIRTTANAWAETTAVKFEVPPEMAANLPAGSWEGGDDAAQASWVPASRLDAVLFGSHRLLIARVLS